MESGFDHHRAEWLVPQEAPDPAVTVSGWRFRGDGVAIYMTPHLVGPDMPGEGTRAVSLICEFCGHEIEVLGVDGPDGRVICSGLGHDKHAPALMRASA